MGHQRARSICWPYMPCVLMGRCMHSRPGAVGLSSTLAVMAPHVTFS